MGNVEITNEKKITITSVQNSGSELKAIHTVSENGITIDIRNGSEPISTIPLTLNMMENLAEWLVERAKEIKKGQE